MKARILKRMISLGKTLEVGDIVDVSTWRHVKALESNRYIALIIEEAPKEEKPKVKKINKKEEVTEE